MSVNRNLTSSPLSSAQSSQATFQTASSQSKPRFRQAQTLPFELLQQVKVYLEESLFTQALRFLQGLILPVVTDSKKLVPIPPPHYIALLTTLTIHPSFTSRASTQERSAQSNLAFKLLKTINEITGPVNTLLSDAYRFRRYDSLPATRSQRRRNLDTSDMDESDEDASSTRDVLNSSYADEDSLYSLAEDFWSVIGWALNCSCLPGIYTTRWNYWQPWLEYMLDVLETDWELREETDSCTHSLLYQYIKSAIGGNVRGRRILRAIFADGGTAARKEFREIFRKELKEPRSEKDKEKERREKNAKKDIVVDVDNEIYGDWMKDEDSSTDEEDGTTTAAQQRRDDRLQTRPTKRLRTIRTPRATSKKRSLLQQEADIDSDTSTQDENNNNNTENILGGPKSIIIRLRFLQLLSSFSASLTSMTPNPEPIFPDLHELYTLFVEFIRPLPLPTFQSIILPSGCSSTTSSRNLQPESRIALCEFILQRLVDSDSENSGISTFAPMTQQRLSQEYLPYAALKNSIEAQAKISLLLEAILRQLTDGSNSRNDVLRRTPEFVRVVLGGIEARLKKAGEIRESVRGKRGNEKDAELAFDMLRESNARIKFVVENFMVE